MLTHSGIINNDDLFDWRDLTEFVFQVLLFSPDGKTKDTYDVAWLGLWSWTWCRWWSSLRLNEIWKVIAVRYLKGSRWMDEDWGSGWMDGLRLLLLVASVCLSVSPSVASWRRWSWSTLSVWGSRSWPATLTVEVRVRIVWWWRSTLWSSPSVLLYGWVERIVGWVLNELRKILV